MRVRVKVEARGRLSTKRRGCRQAAAHPPLPKEIRRESEDEVTLCSSSSSSSPPRSSSMSTCGGAAQKKCAVSRLREHPRPFPWRWATTAQSVRLTRHGRSHPPSPRPPPAHSKPQSRAIRRTGAASDSSMISDGRSSGPDKKDVGAARAAGRSSSSLDESPMTAQAPAAEANSSWPTGKMANLFFR